MGKKGINEQRLKTIYLRQREPRWDSTYQPAILATREEAPSCSRAAILTPEKLGREVHVLSRSEKAAALLGLYHPQFIGLQEQRMLSPQGAPHPLFTMPGVQGILLSPLRGVIDVASRLGYLQMLPKITVPDPAQVDTKRAVVFPFVGDLLWAVRDQEQIRCLNWTVKDKSESFKKRKLIGARKTNRVTETEQAIARHTIERVFYEDAGIPTVQVAGDQIDLQVVGNLRQLFLHHRRKLRVNDEQRIALEERFRSALQTDIPPADAILSFLRHQKVESTDAVSCLYQMVWRRQLRVDLFAPILIDRPLRPETRDVLDVYAQWFRG